MNEWSGSGHRDFLHGSGCGEEAALFLNIVEKDQRIHWNNFTRKAIFVTVGQNT